MPETDLLAKQPSECGGLLSEIQGLCGNANQGPQMRSNERMKVCYGATNNINILTTYL